MATNGGRDGFDRCGAARSCESGRGTTFLSLMLMFLVLRCSRLLRPWCCVSFFSNESLVRPGLVNEFLFNCIIYVPSLAFPRLILLVV